MVPTRTHGLFPRLEVEITTNARERRRWIVTPQSPTMA